jgi:hypothetical protein
MVERWQPQFYKLDGHDTVRVETYEAWLDWFSTHGAETRIRHKIVGKLRISTIFIGIDTRLGFGASPPLFETAVFGPNNTEADIRRSATYDEAIETHERFVAIAQRLAADSE